MPVDNNKKDKAENYGVKGVEGFATTTADIAAEAGQRAIREHIQKSRDIKSIEQSLGKIAESGDTRSLESLPSWLQKDLSNSNKFDNAESVHDLAKSVVKGHGVNYANESAKIFSEAADRSSHVRTEEQNTAKVSSGEDTRGSKVDVQQESTTKVETAREDSSKVVQVNEPEAVSAGQNYMNPALGPSVGGEFSQQMATQQGPEAQQMMPSAPAPDAKMSSGAGAASGSLAAGILAKNNPAYAAERQMGESLMQSKTAKPSMAGKARGEEQFYAEKVKNESEIASPKVQIDNAALSGKVKNESALNQAGKAAVKSDMPDGLKVKMTPDGISTGKTFITDAVGNKISAQEFMYDRYDLSDQDQQRLMQILGGKDPYYMGSVQGADVRQDFFRNRDKAFQYLKANGIDASKLSKKDLEKLVKDGKIKLMNGKTIRVPLGTDAHMVLKEYARLDAQKVNFQNLVVKDMKASIKAKDALSPKVKTAEERVGKVKGEAKGSLYKGKTETSDEPFISGKVRTRAEKLGDNTEKVGSVAGKKNVSDKVKVKGGEKDSKVSSKVNVRKKDQEKHGKKPKERPKGLRGLVRGVLRRGGSKLVNSTKNSENSTYMEKSLASTASAIAAARNRIRMAKGIINKLKAIINFIIHMFGIIGGLLIAMLPIIIVVFIIALMIGVFMIFLNSGGDGNGEAGKNGEAYRTAYNNIQASMINLFEANKYKGVDASGQGELAESLENGDTGSTGEAVFGAGVYTKLLQESWYNQMTSYDKTAALTDPLTMIIRKDKDGKNNSTKLTDRGFNLSRYWGPADVDYSAKVWVWDGVDKDGDDIWTQEKMTIQAIAGLNGDLNEDRRPYSGSDWEGVDCYGDDLERYHKTKAYTALFGATNPDLQFGNGTKPYIFRGCDSTQTWSSGRSTNFTTSKGKTLAYDGAKVKGENRLMRALTVMTKFYVEDPDDKMFTPYMQRLSDMALDSAEIKLTYGRPVQDRSKTVKWDYTSHGRTTHVEIPGYARTVQLTCNMDNIGILDLMRMDQYGGTFGGKTYEKNDDYYAHANSDKTYASDSITWKGWFDSSGNLTEAGKNAVELYESFEENDIGADTTWEVVFGSTSGVTDASGAQVGGMAAPLSTERINSIMEDVRAQGASGKSEQMVYRALKEVGRHVYGKQGNNAGHSTSASANIKGLDKYGSGMDCSGFITCLLSAAGYNLSSAGTGAASYVNYGSSAGWSHSFDNLKPGTLIIKNDSWGGYHANGSVSSGNHIVMYLGVVDIGDGNGKRPVCVESTTTTDAFGRKCSGPSLSSPKRMNYIKSYSYARKP